MIDLDTAMSWTSNTEILGISVASWSLACAVAVGTYALVTFVLRMALLQASRYASRSATVLDDAAVEVLGGTSYALLALVSVLIGLGLLDLPDRWSDRVGQLWFVALALQVALWASRGIGIGLRRYTQQHSSPGMTQVSASATLMSWGLRTVLWAIVLLSMLSNLGVNITAFVASLGVGGIAVALAVQNILGDLFASLSIAVDKPFEVGDSITVNGISGTVEHVGLKSTRIRGVVGEQIVMSNTDLLKNTISNYKRLEERRIAFTIGVDYRTTPEQLQAIPGLLRRLIESRDQLRFDRAHFKGFGPHSLDFEVVYIVLSPDYVLYMDAQQAINIDLMQNFQEMGVRFAFPTRTVILSNESEPAPSAPGETAGGALRPPGRDTAHGVSAPAGPL